MARSQNLVEAELHLGAVRVLAGRAADPQSVRGDLSNHGIREDLFPELRTQARVDLDAIAVVVLRLLLRERLTAFRNRLHELIEANGPGRCRARRGGHRARRWNASAGGDSVPCRLTPPL